jgi:Fe-S cluster assembly protein SufD
MMETMTLNTPANFFIEQWKSIDRGSAFRAIREAGFSNFEKNGFPPMKHEEWKYTSLQSMFVHSFEEAEKSYLGKEDFNQFMIAGSGVYSVILENGRLNTIVNEVLPAGLTIGKLSDFTSHSAVVNHLAKHADHQSEHFVALNTAFLEDGIIIHVDKNVSIAKPVHIIIVSNAESNNIVSHPRILVVADEGSSVNIIESNHSVFSTHHSFTNSVTEIFCDKKSKVEYSKIQLPSENDFIISHTEAVLNRDARFDIHTISAGGRLLRNNLHILMDDVNANAWLNGLYIGGNATVMDNHTLVDHSSPNCYSNELYKGILAGKAQGIFNGKIFVRQDAQKTNAYQSNKNILLSDEATMNAKPQLEIFADDVKCSHGATTGQLDEEALFYLRSRGIGLSTARTFLTMAFAADVTNRISSVELRENLKLLVENWLNEEIS